MVRRISKRDLLVLVPVAAILALVLALTAAGAPANAASSAAPKAVPAYVPAGSAVQQVETPICKSCHAVESTAWEASTHAKAGATCESCHGEYKEGHPNGETMTLPMESKTCRTCHQTEFAAWEQSKHGAKNVDCFDCHVAHSQGLRLEPAEKLCSACHADEQTKLSHAVHGISGIDCVSCHMKPQMGATANTSTQGAAGTTSFSNHTFVVASDVCAGCHSGSIHSDTSAKAVQVSAKAEETVQQAAASAQRVTELEAQVNADQQRIKDLTNVAVVSMGLMLGLGAAVGLVIGIVATTLFSRRKAQ